MEKRSPRTKERGEQEFKGMEGYKHFLKQSAGTGMVFKALV